MGKNKNANFSKPFNGRIFIFWNPFIYIFICPKIKKFTIGNFLSLDACSGPMWALLWGWTGWGSLCNSAMSSFHCILSGLLVFFTADWSSIRDVLQLQEQLKYFHCQSKLDPPHSPKVGDWTSFGLHFLFLGWSALSRPFSRTSFYQRPDERHDSFYR